VFAGIHGFVFSPEPQKGFVAAVIPATFIVKLNQATMQQAAQVKPFDGILNGVPIISDMREARIIDLR
jgi:hypothetical protein